MEVGNKQGTAEEPKVAPSSNEPPRPAFRPTKAWVPTLGLLGIFLLAGMFVLYAMQGTWGTWNWALGAGGVVLIVSYVALDAKNIGATIGSRRFAIGTNVTFVTALAIVLWGFANTINQRHYKRWDLTKAGTYSISDRTRDILKSLDKDLKITSLVIPNSSDPGANAILNNVNDFLDEYKAASPRVSVEVIDPNRDPMKARQIEERLKLSADDLYSVIFECGDRTKRVGVDEIVEREPQNPYNPTPSGSSKFKGEEAFTSAILNVIEDKQTTLYFVGGHGEAKTDDYSSRGAGELGRFLPRQNIHVSDLPIDTGKDIPPDCDVLVINGPKKPYSDAEQAVLRRYLDKGGKAFIMLTAPRDPESDSGLGALLRDYGVEVGTNIVLETDPRHAILSMTWPLVDSFGDHPITEKMKNLRVLFPETRSVDVASETHGYDVTTLLRTSENSWAETNFASLSSEEAAPAFDAGVDKKGPVSIAVAVSKKAADGEKASGLRMVVTGTSIFAGNQFFGEVSNTDFFMNCVNWLQSRENRITIGAKSLDVPMVTLSLEQSSRLFWFSIAAMPGLCLVLGGIVYVKRRR
ncbi:MAG: GldG family protein [Planctomycetes bacterium]|nr:GldG family protein [Planctomycetota bacterium]MBI3843690.1 GldG family protein [Planctomycetota bacterium]